MMKVAVARSIGIFATIWAVALIAYSGFFAYGDEKAWFMSFGNSILNLTLIYLFIVLLTDIDALQAIFKKEEPVIRELARSFRESGNVTRADN